MGQLVLPVFYNVNPSDVRHQNGSFAEAFEKHKICFVADMDKVEKWRATLIEVADLSGYHLDENENEADHIEKIVDKVLLHVNPRYLNVAKYPIGICSRVKGITPLMKFGINDVVKRVRRIGIYGMGGVGKTTIAKAVYNQSFRRFEGSCFIANVREVSGQLNGLVCLQEQFLSEILKIKKFTIDSVAKGISLIRERICHRKVLIVLDDLYHLSQLYALAGPWNLFSRGSVIIITTRDACLLDQIQVEDRYLVNELNNDESLELFSRHAFGKTRPLNDFMTISKDIVQYAGGLPLALEVFGSTLFEQNMIGWRSFIEKLRQVPDKKIQEKLIISYDVLDDANLMDIFLDIACFFVGMNKSEAVAVLETCYNFVENEINILIKKCLLTLNDNNELRMHDLVRNMGREIVRHKFPKEPEKRNRLWSSRDICNVLQKYKGTKAIEGIVSDEKDEFKELHKVTLNAKTFLSMHRLRLLDINGVHLTGSFNNIFEELRWLSWMYCPLECLPSDFHPEKLVILQLSYGKIKILWHGTLFLEQLKTLNLKSCEYLTTTPDFTGVPCLENLILSYCVSLVEVHPSIGSLGRLVYLDLSYCESLRILPSNLGNLRALERLYLHSCENLEGLPENLGNMECLWELRAGYYTKVNKMPDSIGYMKKLEILTMSSLRSRTDTGFVPPSISGLCSLRVLNLNFCNLFDGDLPDTIGSLSALEDLKLSKNNFSALPFSLSQLFNLKSLHLNGCQSLRTLPELPPNLEYLNASDCTSMEKLPNLSNLNRLEKLYLTNCSKLAEIQGLEKLNSISFISIIGCNNVTNTFKESFFQVYSGFGKKIEIFLPTREIPDWFSHQNMGCSICFDMPADERNNLTGIIVWVVGCGPSEAFVKIGSRWIHSLWSWSFEEYSAISFIPSISSGVKIEVSVKGEYSNVERCGVHLVYRPDTTEMVKDVDTEPQAKRLKLQFEEMAMDVDTEPQPKRLNLQFEEMAMDVDTKPHPKRLNLQFEEMVMDVDTEPQPKRLKLQFERL